MSIRVSIFGTLIVATVLAMLVQLLIAPTTANMWPVCIVTLSSLAMLGYCGWTKALQTQPLSTIAIIGFGFTTQLGALLVQTILWTPIGQSLYDPVYTFGNFALYQAVAILVHAAYRFFSVTDSEHTGPVRGLFSWAGLYRTPKAQELWFMGCVGLFSFFFQHQEGIIGKISLGFNFLTWSPFLIPFYMREVGDSYCNATRNRIALVFYTGAVALMGIALNARQIMFVGVLTIGLLYLLAGMRSESKPTFRALMQLGALGLVLLAIAKPVSDLATSMVIARELRGKISPIAMIETTYRVWRHPALIEAYKSEGAARSRYAAYDEIYIMNPGLARFVSTKYHDNAFHFARLLTSEDAQRQLREHSWLFVLSSFPTPLLSAIGVHLDKDDLGYSMGDYLLYLARGVPVGGRKIGSMFAQGIALFGPVLFPFVYGFICLGMFWLMDLMTIRRKAAATSLSALAMLQLWPTFSAGISYEALHLAVNYFIRSFEQTLLIYLMIFGLARFMMHVFGPPEKTPRQPTWMVQRS